MTVNQAVPRTCHAKLVGGAKGVATKLVLAPSSADGLVRAKLKGSGDWDLAVFESKSGRRIAASSGPGATEVATGFADAGKGLTVQACRYGGASKTADLTTDVVTLKSKPQNGKIQVVEVATANRKAKNRLQSLGLDLTEHGDADGIEVVLYGAEDVKKLKDAGFRFRVRVADVQAKVKQERAADRAFAAATPRSALPSGRTSYRTLADYEADLRTLAQRYPTLVKPLTLPYKTHEGREVHGVELTRNAGDVDDGKPIFLQMGVHHAREWPSSEHAIEFAFDLAQGYGKDSRITRLMDAARTIVVPVVNPDGFNISRSADDGVYDEESFTRFSYELKRKNCRPFALSPAGTPCADNPLAGRLQGVDPNRNYGGLWGGPGAATGMGDTPDEVEASLLDDTYRGPGPFSEPETQNIRALHSTRTITNLISNHTYGNLLLRPPGTIDIGTPLDEPLLKSLGADMAEHNAYANIPSYGLYDTTGATEDWTYWTAGSLGYTFEINDKELFHPRYETGVVDEYVGGPTAQGNGKGGNRAAYLDMLEATADPTKHSVISGQAPAGWKLTLSKTFMTETHDPKWLNDFGTKLGPPDEFQDTLKYELRTKGGRFDWHVNPSTRPIVAGRLGREATGPKQADFALPNPTGLPALGDVEEIPFTIAEGFDNGRATVHIEWDDPLVDWDVYVVNSAGDLVAQSAAFGDANEDAAWLDPVPGEYTAIVVNYDQDVRNGDPSTWDDWRGEVRFRSPSPTVVNPPEAWQLSCEKKSGDERTAQAVVVERGQRVDVGKVCQKPKKVKVKG